jgi:transposase
MDGMHRTSQNNIEWRRYKEVSVPWAKYDVHRLNECKHVLNLKDLFIELDKPVQRREFKLSQLTVLLLFKMLFGISYRGIASACKDLNIYTLLGMKRAPCYKTIQNTMNYFDEQLFIKINQTFVSSKVKLAGIDSSGIKTNKKGAWIQIRFRKPVRRHDFKKVHIFVDLNSKKILYCIMTNGRSYDSTHLKQILNQCNWIKFEIILGDGGYDSKECFNEIAKQGAIPGIPVRKNSITRSKGSPTRRKSVIAQQKDFNKWKEQVQYTMRCIVESVFSGTKRRFGEYLFSLKEKFRSIEIWMRTILWNVLIYPR